MGQSEHGLLSEIANSHALERSIIDGYVEKFSSLNGLVDNTQSIFFIFNYHTLELEFVSDNAYELTGKDRGFFEGSGESLMKKIFNDKDINLIFRNIRKEFQEVRGRYDHEDLGKLSFQVFTRTAKELCGGRNHLFQYQILESDEEGKPLLCFGSLTETGFATSPQYISVAASYRSGGKNQVVFQKIHPLKDSSLSNREKEVVKLLVDGMTSTEVAENLSISSKTVNNHRQNILRKLDAKSTNEVVKYAMIRGLY